MSRTARLPEVFARRGGGLPRSPIACYVGPPVELDGLRTPSRATYGTITTLAHESVRCLRDRRQAGSKR